jgi:hypothetical protein
MNLAAILLACTLRLISTSACSRSLLASAAERLTERSTTSCASAVSVRLSSRSSFRALFFELLLLVGLQNRFMAVIKGLLACGRVLQANGRTFEEESGHLAFVLECSVFVKFLEIEEQSSVCDAVILDASPLLGARLVFRKLAGIQLGAHLDGSVPTLMSISIRLVGTSYRCSTNSISSSGLIIVAVAA